MKIRTEQEVRKQKVIDIEIYLLECHEKDVIAQFSEIEKLARIKIKEDRSILQTALIHVEELGYVFKNIRCVGYRILKNDEILPVCEKRRTSRLKSQVTKLGREIKCTNYSQLPETLKEKHKTVSMKYSIYQAMLSEQMDKTLIKENKLSNVGIVSIDLKNIVKGFQELQNV
jgi:hypothetical protein